MQLRGSELLGSLSTFEGNVDVVAFHDNGKWGLVDFAGRGVAKPVWDEPIEPDPSGSGMALVKRDGGWGVIDRTGAVVLSPKYPRIEFAGQRNGRTTVSFAVRRWCPFDLCCVF